MGLVIRLLIQIEPENIGLAAVAAVTSLTVPVARIEENLAVGAEQGQFLRVPALRNVHNLAGGEFDRRHLRCPKLVAVVRGGQPARVGREGVFDVAIGVGVVFASRNDRARFFRLQVHHHDLVAILQVRELLAVRRDHRLERLVGCDQERIFGHYRRVGERLVLFAGNRGLVEVPGTAAFAVVIERATILAPGDIPLLLGRIGNPLGRTEFNRRDKHLPAYDQSDLLLIGGNGVRGGSAATNFPAGIVVPLIGGHIDRKLFGGLPLRLAPNLAVEPVEKGTILGEAQKTDRVRFMVGQLAPLGRIGRIDLPDVERSSLLGEVVEGFSIGGPDRVAIFTAILRQPRLLARFRVAEHDVAGNAGGVVLPPAILDPLVVVECKL